MDIFSVEEKTEIIKELCEKNNFTAYEIGKGTGLSISGVQRILNNEVKKPHNETLNMILEFLENRQLGSSFKTQDDKEKTVDDLINEKIAKKLDEANEKIDSLSTVILRIKKELNDVKVHLNLID